MNAHESDKLRSMLRAKGFCESPEPTTADVLIFQTCSIRDTASRKIRMHISQAKRFRQKNDLKQIICVIGCLSATEQIDGVDIVLGTNEIKQLLNLLASDTAQDDFGVGNSIAIMHGCDNYCSYCIVPYARGRETSRTVDEIITEFMQIKNNTEKPIVLLGQNVNSYLCPKTKMNFVGLLDKLCAIDGDFQINFMSSHPKDFSRELVDCIARNPKIERNIHLPMQSASDRVLKLMNRKYTFAEYKSKIDMLRSAVPDVRITTDVICGFPTETENDYNDTVNAMKEIKFNSAFIFPYSRRQGTTADVMDGHLDKSTIMSRTTKLINLQRTRT